VTRYFASAALHGLLVLLSGEVFATTSAGDATRGEQVYQRCLACHALSYNRVGPLHCGVVGRSAGSVHGFVYSAGMRESGIVWTAATLDAFLAAPTQYVKGTTMGYAGLEDGRDRRDLIAFLKAASDDPARCPPITTGRKQ